MNRKKLLSNDCHLTKDETAKPGTANSKQAILPPNPTHFTRSSHKTTKKPTSNEPIDTKNYVDESFISFIVEFGQLKGLRKEELPKDPLDLCKNITIWVNEAEFN